MPPDDRLFEEKALAAKDRVNPIASYGDEDTMEKRRFTRRELLRASSALGLAAAVPISLSAARVAAAAEESPREHSTRTSVTLSPLKPPAKGPIPVAFPISEGAVLIDFAGPWEVFQSATIPGGDLRNAVFDNYTVAETLHPITIDGGMKVVPNYTFQNAPAPKVIAIPAQNGHSEAMLRWIRTASESADLTMSICTGAFVLAATGLLDGKKVTTHHAAYTQLAMQFPKVIVERGSRFVEEGKLATSGGLTSGMDLALRVIGRYFGQEAIERTAFLLEYQGKGWMDAASNAEFAVKPRGDICAVCWMSVNRKIALSEVFQGQTYYFCMKSHQDAFNQNPVPYIKLLSESHTAAADAAK
jgi:putative intracellular protease/amidase/YHS domain-containing protein